MKLFTKYQVVETRASKPLDAAAKDSVPSLQHHPGFQYLMGKLRLQREALESVLKKTRHEDIRQVDCIQSGIAWLEYLELFVNKEVYNAGRPAPVDATEEQETLFRAAAANLDLL